MNVFLIKDGVRIGRTLTDERGDFRFDNVGPGIYSLMAVGPDGLGVVGFELTPEMASIAPANVQTRANDGKRFVVQPVVQASNVFDLQVIPVRPEEFTVIDDRVIDEEEVIIGEPIFSDIPMDGVGFPISGGGFVPGGGGGFGGPGGGGPGGGGPGGGGYGGGGGGGGGGLGGLAALAGIGAVVAAASSDDDSTPVAISPVVP